MGEVSRVWPYRQVRLEGWICQRFASHLLVPLAWLVVLLSVFVVFFFRVSCDRLHDRLRRCPRILLVAEEGKKRGERGGRGEKKK